MTGSLQTLRIERPNATTVVVALNRPEVRNAFHPLMIDEMTRVFTVDINRDSKLRVVILRGEGKAFCAGADLNWMKSMVDFTLEENRGDSDKLFAMFAAIRSCHVPVLGLVHGHVMGGAVGLAAVCDIVAAEESTQFCFSEARLGLAPAVISPFVLEKMHASAAHRYMMTAEIFSASAARDAGLVHEVGSREQIEAFIEKTAATIRENGPEAVRATKGLLRLYAERSGDWETLRRETARVIAERRVSDEGQEGLRGFLEKRQPSWKGN